MSRYDARATKVREIRLRRAAERQGLMLRKSRRRDPRAYDFGAYWLVDPSTDAIVAGDGRFGASLDEIEAWLAGGRAPRKRSTP